MVRRVLVAYPPPGRRIPPHALVASLDMATWVRRGGGIPIVSAKMGRAEKEGTTLSRKKMRTLSRSFRRTVLKRVSSTSMNSGPLVSIARSKKPNSLPSLFYGVSGSPFLLYLSITDRYALCRRQRLRTRAIPRKWQGAFPAEPRQLVQHHHHNQH